MHPPSPSPPSLAHQPSPSSLSPCPSKVDHAASRGGALQVILRPGTVVRDNLAECRACQLSALATDVSSLAAVAVWSEATSASHPVAGVTVHASGTLFARNGLSAARVASFTPVTMGGGGDIMVTAVHTAASPGSTRGGVTVTAYNVSSTGSAGGSLLVLARPPAEATPAQQASVPISVSVHASTFAGTLLLPPVAALLPSGSVQVSNTTVQGGGGGVSVGGEGSKLVVQDCLFKGTQWEQRGTGVTCSLGAACSVLGSVFEDCHGAFTTVVLSGWADAVQPVVAAHVWSPQRLDRQQWAVPSLQWTLACCKWMGVPFDAALQSLVLPLPPPQPLPSLSLLPCCTLVL